MRIRALAVLILGSAVTLTLSLTRGQEKPAPRAQAPVITTPSTLATPPKAKPAEARPAPDLSGLSELQKQMLLTAQRGSDWLFRMHGVKGRFLYGQLPALAQDMEGDHYMRQAGAAFALARAARCTGEDRFAARATQAVLALLEDTVTDETDKSCLHTSLPSGLVNRLGSAGYLVMAINELPLPQKDLLEKSEQLCNYIRKQARDDGSLAYHDGKDEADGINEHPGAALYGLALSMRHRPAEWKTQLLRKALPYYCAWWKKNPSPAFAPLMAAAYAEAHALTKDRACAEFVLEMSDWLCPLQYTRLEPRRLSWYGGFMSWQGGRAVESMPTVEGAGCAEALVEGCRAARALGDVARFKNYAETLEHALRFLSSLQYTESATQHFADWYRPRLVGGFHHSPADGNLRIDYNRHAVSALWGYLEHGRER